MAAKQFITGLVVIGLLFVPLEAARAQATAPSRAVISTTQSTLIALFNRAAAHKATSVDYASAASALRVMFANWDETGTTDRLQAAMLSNSNAVASPTQQHDLYVSLSGAGVAVSESDVNSAFAAVSQKHAEAVSRIQSIGLRQMNAAIVQALNNKALALAVRPNPNLLTVQTAGSCEVIYETIALYLEFVAVATAAEGVGEVLGLIALLMSMYATNDC